MDADGALVDRLIQQGLATREQIEAARASQARRAGGGAPPPLAAVLTDLGIVTAAQLADLADPGALADGMPTLAAPQEDADSAAQATVLGPASAPAAEPRAPGAGETFGRYVLERRLGAGGMGVVWKAQDTDLHRPVALKLIRSGGLRPEALARFEREARLSAKLRHPGIVQVHDVGEANGQRYLTMDYVQGSTLSAVLEPRRASKQKGDPAGLADLRHEIGLVAEVAAATAYAHGEGIIHRDLKPANVMVDESDRALVMDFGLAREVEAGPDERERRARLTQEGSTLGTPLYMSPEQAGTGTEAGPASDIWALGVILYEVLAGRTPFEHLGQNPWTVMAAVVGLDVEPPRRHNPRSPEELEAVALKALERDPAKRYASAAAFEEELRRWLRGDPVEARPLGALGRWRRRLVRHRMAVALTAITLTLGTWAGASTWSAARVRGELLERLREVAADSIEGARACRRMGLPAAIASHRRALADACGDAVRLLGEDTAEAHHALGRFEREAMRDDEALALQRKALAADPGHEAARVEAGVLEARAWLARIAWTRAEHAVERAAWRLSKEAWPAPDQLDPPTVREQEAKEPDLRALRESAQTRLRGAPGPAVAAWIAALDEADAGGWEATASVVGPVERAESSEPCEALALAALRAGRIDEALAASARGEQVDPGFLPLTRWAGVAHLLRAGERASKDEDPQAEIAGAGEAFERALERMANDPASSRGRAAVALLSAARRAGGGESPETAWGAAVEGLEIALHAGSETGSPSRWLETARRLAQADRRK